MKTFIKIFKWIGITLCVLVVIFLVVVYARQDLKFDAPYPDIKASTDSAIIARGEYLFYGPAHCLECHTTMETYKEVASGKRMPPIGGFEFKLPVGVIRTRNITSDMETGVGKLSDKEIARTLRYGVNPKGNAVLEFMPFHNTSDEDLTALISFIRTLPPVKHEVPQNEYNFLGKVVRAFLIKPVGPDEEPPKKVTPEVSVEYGKYLANSIANCRGCHTNRDLMTGGYIGEFYAGGFHFEIEGRTDIQIVSPNLTPDEKTGHIRTWSVEQFIKRFRDGKLIPDSPMPWGPFAHFSDDDLRAIYMYLQSVKPVNNDAGPAIQSIQQAGS